MDETTKEINTEAKPQEAAASPAAVAAPAHRERGTRTRMREPRKNPRRGRGSDTRPRSEFDQKLIDIRRVARVVSGGRRFSFSVVIVIGNRKGQVGVGIGKAGDTSLAIDKALRNAKRNLVTISLTKNNSIPHEVDAKYSSARVVITPSRGRGLVAGSSVRNVLELAGITDVSAKIRSGSKNKLNIARGAIKALSHIRTMKK